MGTTNTFLETVRSWRAADLLGHGDAMLQMYACVLTWRENGRYDVIDEALSWVTSEEFSPSFRIGLLTITASCAKYLKNRYALYEVTRAKLAETKGEKKADRALLGLQCKPDSEDAWAEDDGDE